MFPIPIPLEPRYTIAISIRSRNRSLMSDRNWSNCNNHVLKDHNLGQETGQNCTRSRNLRKNDIAWVLFGAHGTSAGHLELMKRRGVVWRERRVNKRPFQACSVNLYGWQVIGRCNLRSKLHFLTFVIEFRFDYVMIVIREYEIRDRLLTLASLLRFGQTINCRTFAVVGCGAW